MFKRRKPDEPSSASIDGPLPAGLPVIPETSRAEQSDSDFRPATVSPVQPPLDNGLGVPPFRPAPLKDAHNMSRPPFPSAPTTPASPAPPASARPGATMVRPGSRDPSERRTLVVGRGISVQGVVQDAERLVVEGTVEATMIHATELAIAPGGVFKGEIEVEDAEIAGTIDGTLTARGSMIIRGSGKVLGTARCRRLQVEDGGQITGRIEMITDQPQSDLPPRQNAEPAI
ncbi:polymer-forming cytoskeletal protein [Acidisphaera sp. S103]|uniref:bactofilin family protein n=1 Tax=Acidisphaera sp. S103 TaxID=1747223 RepID=UPI0020B11C8D|nr:polymer-forming cytoskeletal protein [Acidisphaera sp. S103]